MGETEMQPEIVQVNREIKNVEILTLTQEQIDNATVVFTKEQLKKLRIRLIVFGIMMGLAIGIIYGIMISLSFIRLVLA